MGSLGSNSPLFPGQELTLYSLGEEVPYRDTDLWAQMVAWQPASRFYDFQEKTCLLDPAPSYQMYKSPNWPCFVFIFFLNEWNLQSNPHFHLLATTLGKILNFFKLYVMIYKINLITLSSGLLKELNKKIKVSSTLYITSFSLFFKKGVAYYPLFPLKKGKGNRLRLFHLHKRISCHQDNKTKNVLLGKVVKFLKRRNRKCRKRSNILGPMLHSHLGKSFWSKEDGGTFSDSQAT